jgi:uncharacterized protein with HEPN domain
MPRDFRLYLDDILEAIDSIQTYAGNLSYEDLIADRMRVDAIIRNFTVIGEAAGAAPADLRATYPDIEWRKIIDFRNVIVHEYFGIDHEILWDIIRNKLPQLRAGIDRIRRGAV